MITNRSGNRDMKDAVVFLASASIVLAIVALACNALITPPTSGKIAFTSERDGDLEIYLMNADGAEQTRLTHNTGYDQGPTWSPGGMRIAFHSWNGFLVDRSTPQTRSLSRLRRPPSK